MLFETLKPIYTEVKNNIILTMWETDTGRIKYTARRPHSLHVAAMYKDDTQVTFCKKLFRGKRYHIDDLDLPDSDLIRAVIDEATWTYESARRIFDELKVTPMKTFLLTKQDYNNAPVGTIVALNNHSPHMKYKLNTWTDEFYDALSDRELAGTSRKVLRWGGDI